MPLTHTYFGDDDECLSHEERYEARCRRLDAARRLLAAAESAGLIGSWIDGTARSGSVYVYLTVRGGRTFKVRFSSHDGGGFCDWEWRPRDRVSTIIAAARAAETLTQETHA